MSGLSQGRPGPHRAEELERGAQYVGYDRYESAAALVQMRKVYELLRLYVNFYQPVMKLIGKEREGSRVTKRYDEARTPLGGPWRLG